MKKQVFRFENKDGVGIYRAERRPGVEQQNGEYDYFIRSIAGQVIDDTYVSHLTPYEDSKLKMSFRSAGVKCDSNNKELFPDGTSLWEDRFFGFESEDHARKWFFKNEWLVGFWSYDIVLAIYEVEEEHIYFGDTQLMFYRPGSTKTVHDIVDYFKLTDFEGEYDGY